MRLSQKRDEEDANLHQIIEENHKLQEELKHIMNRRYDVSSFRKKPDPRRDRSSDAFHRESHQQSQARPADTHAAIRDTAVTFGAGTLREDAFDRHRKSDLSEDSDHWKTHVKAPRKDRADYSDNEKLRETIDALEFMKKREKALQEEVRSLSQVVIK